MKAAPAGMRYVTSKLPTLAAATAVLALLGAACGGQTSADLEVGEAAPGFTLTATDGTTVSLSDYVGSKSVLLYFSMGYG